MFQIPEGQRGGFQVLIGGDLLHPAVTVEAAVRFGDKVVDIGPVTEVIPVAEALKLGMGMASEAAPAISGVIAMVTGHLHGLTLPGGLKIP